MSGDLSVAHFTASTGANDLASTLITGKWTADTTFDEAALPRKLPHQADETELPFLVENMSYLMPSQLMKGLAVRIAFPVHQQNSSLNNLLTFLRTKCGTPIFKGYTNITKQSDAASKMCSEASQ